MATVNNELLIRMRLDLGQSSNGFAKTGADIEKIGDSAQRAKAKIDPFIAAMSKSLSTGEIKMASGFRQAGEAAEAATRKAAALGKTGEQAGEKIYTGSNKAADAAASLRNQLLGILSVYKALDAAKAVINAGAQFDSVNKSLAATTGSSSGAAKELEYVKQKANEYGASLKALAAADAQFLAASQGTNLEGEKSRKIFESITKASAALGLSIDDQKGALNAVAQMMSKGSIQAEELRGQLGERLPGAFNIMARALGVSTAELNKMLDAGEVGIDVLPRFAEELDKTFKNARFDDIQSSINRISTAWDNLLVSAGKVVHLDVILKTVADVMTPETQDQTRARLGAQLNGLDRMSLVDNLRYRLGTASWSDWNGSSLGADQTRYDQLTKQNKASQAGDYFVNGTKLGAELDALIKEQEASAKNYEVTTKGIADATERLWKKNREEIEAAEKAAASAAKSLQSSFESARSGLEKEIALRGENTEAAKMEYEVQYGAFQGLSEAQKLKLLNLAAENDAVNANIEAYKEYDDILAAGEKLALKQRQDMDKYSQAVADLRRNIADFSGSNISQTGFNSLLAKIQDTAQGADQKALFDELGRAFNDGFITPAKYGTNELSEFSIQAARNIQSSFADFLFDPFANDTASMVDNFAKALRRMMAEAASAQIFNALLGKDFGKSGELGGLLGSLGTAISGAFGGGSFQGNGPLLSYMNHSGGLAGQTPYKLFDAAIFNTAPRYHTGGIAGLMPNEVPTVLTKGEEVLTTDDPRHRNNLVAAAGNVEVNIYNQADGTRASATKRQTSQGTQIDILVEQVENAMGQNIARGTGLAPVMEKQYGLNRAAGSF